MASEKKQLKDKWLEEFGRYFVGDKINLMVDDSMNQGDLIGFPLSELLISHINDNFFAYHKEKGLYPYVFGQKKTDVCIPHDYMLILQFLGDGNFLELISGKVIIDNGSFIKALSSDTYNIGDFQRELDYYRNTPIDCSNIEEYGYPMSDELKVLYANTSLNNQEYIEEIMDKLEAEGRKTISDELNNIAANSQDEAESLLKAEEFIKRRIR